MVPRQLRFRGTHRNYSKYIFFVSYFMLKNESLCKFDITDTHGAS